MDLGCGQPDPADIGQRVHHIVDKSGDFRIGGVLDRVGAAFQHGVAHSGDFQDGHGSLLWAYPGIWVQISNLESGFRAGKAPGQLHKAGSLCYLPPPFGWTPGPPVGFFRKRWKGVRPKVQVLVRDNNVDQALRALKKKMQREGIFREMKMRRNYEKPSERKAREKAEAVRRHRKLLRKRMDREGY